MQITFAARTLNFTGKGVREPVGVRLLEHRDIEAVVALQSGCPEAAQWGASSYEAVARGEMTGWVEQDDAGIAGFLVARELVRQTEILNLAVRVDARRLGIGTSLLKEALVWSKSVEAGSVILEVRASNAGALEFYERHGFEVVGRRSRYYVDPVDDALLLSRSVAGGRGWGIP
jgi:[ribosomal protein S18]-alanine N-acetyltransferase